MDMSNAIIERKIGMPESTLLSEAQMLINQMMMRLDLELHRSTLKWGVGRLLELAPPDLLAKWNSQMSKLNEAILAGDVMLVEDLVVGSCRGLEALQRSAIALGHIPFSPEFAEVAMDDGTVYRVVGLYSDAGALEGSAERPVISVGELCRVYHARHLETFKTAREVGREYVASGKPMDQELGF